jgi:hypothetical protein
MSTEGRDLDYDEIAASLRGLPATWYPGLLRALVEASYAASTWQPGGASEFVAQIELGNQPGTGRQHGNRI